MAVEGLKSVELRLVADLTERERGPGYVFDFTDATFAEFFRNEVGIDIDDDAYMEGSGSKGKRLRAFLRRGQPRAIAKALTALWEYREDGRTRDGRAEDVPDARRRLSAVIERLGGRPLLPSDWERSQEHPSEARPSSRPDEVRLQALCEGFHTLHPLDPQTRGYAFEKFLAALFSAWGLDARGGFRNAGEQIDGSFVLGDDVYLIEAKWRDQPTDAATLHAFQGKVLERIEGTRGLFVSYSGFTAEALRAFTARRIILMDGFDLSVVLQRRLPLADVVRAKVRHAAERKEPFTHVSDLNL